MPQHVRFAFSYDGGGPAKGGMVSIVIDGKTVASGRIARSLNSPAGSDETFDVGRDTGVPVVPGTIGQGVFTGDIDKVTIRLAPVLQAGLPSDD